VDEEYSDYKNTNKADVPRKTLKTVPFQLLASSELTSQIEVNKL